MLKIKKTIILCIFSTTVFSCKKDSSSVLSSTEAVAGNSTQCVPREGKKLITDKLLTLDIEEFFSTLRENSSLQDLIKVKKVYPDPSTVTSLKTADKSIIDGQSVNYRANATLSCTKDSNGNSNVGKSVRKVTYHGVSVKDTQNKNTDNISYLKNGECVEMLPDEAIKQNLIACTGFDVTVSITCKNNLATQLKVTSRHGAPYVVYADSKSVSGRLSEHTGATFYEEDVHRSTNGTVKVATYKIKNPAETIRAFLFGYRPSKKNPGGQDEYCQADLNPLRKKVQEILNYGDLSKEEIGLLPMSFDGRITEKWSNQGPSPLTVQ